MKQLLLEAIAVGIIVVIVGTLVSSLIGSFHQKTRSVCRDWNKNHIMEIALFFTGFFTHLLCEMLGINKWYCKNSYACN